MWNGMGFRLGIRVFVRGLLSVFSEGLFFWNAVLAVGDLKNSIVRTRICFCGKQSAGCFLNYQKIYCEFSFFLYARTVTFQQANSELYWCRVLLTN